jgi:Holliday junction DNA helicase RuvA
MIGRIEGKLIERIDRTHSSIATIDIGGFGLEVATAQADLGKVALGDQVILYTDLLVREDSLTLFGFATPARRSLFRMLQTVTGVGPKVALTAIATTESDQLSAAVIDGDIAYLEKIPGIGKKVASRIVLELREKMDLPTKGGGGGVRTAVKGALLNLGYSEKEASSAVADLDTGTSVEQGLKEALKQLNRSGK